MVIWYNGIGVGPWSCTFFKIPPNEGSYFISEDSTGMFAQILHELGMASMERALLKILTFVLPFFLIGSPDDHTKCPSWT